MKPGKQFQLFDPGPERKPEPHEMRHSEFLASPETEFHSQGAKVDWYTKGTPASMPDWDHQSDRAIHTGTLSAAVERAQTRLGPGSDRNVSPLQALRPVDPEQVYAHKRVISDSRANALEEEWSQEDLDFDERTMEPSRRYKNAIEDKGSLSTIHPTSAVLGRHQDFIDAAESIGKHIPPIVAAERKLMDQPRTVVDVLEDWDTTAGWENRQGGTVSQTPDAHGFDQNHRGYSTPGMIKHSLVGETLAKHAVAKKPPKGGKP